MRGDGVGVGDVGEVPGGAWSSGDSAGGDDGRGAGREHDARVLGGRGRIERDAASNRAGTGSASVTVHGASWGWWRTRAGSGGADGMRGDGVGVGDVGEVPGGAWSSGDSAGDDDGRGAREGA